MANDDISRFLFQPAKHYTGARMQQGRVILDSDFNENEQLDDEDIRRDLLNVIGSPGTPQEDPGFAVTDVTQVGDSLDFTIGAGAIYMGGLRFRLDQDQHFLNQTDFLQLAKEDNPALAPTTAGEKRFAVVVEGFEQTVTSVEDTELRERALGAGGPDTSTRVRRTVRVHAFDVTFLASQSCTAGFEAVKTFFLTTGTVGNDSEFLPSAIMTVDFTGDKSTEDLCNPAEEGGYLGAENQAIRVMAVTTTSIVWGFDNASPLYRVQVGTDEQTVTMLDRPRDQAAEPLTGQIVEILPASAVLPNGEIVAGLTGQLARVIRGFDPDDGTIVLAPSSIQLGNFVHGNDFAGFLHYDGAGVPTTDAPFFMRVWNQGSATLSTTDSPSIPVIADTFVPLGSTGLKVKFSGFITPGAFWVIAARPESRQEVIPRSLKTGEPPMGPRKFYAPIAFIRWQFGQTPEVTDCRTPFPPLTKVRGCCNFRVGDGETSFGDFNNIQQAIDALPMEGGQICLLPGTHQGAVNISNRVGITITGCGKKSVVVGEGQSDFRGTGPEPDPVILICDSQEIRLESFYVIGTGRAGIHVQTNTFQPNQIKLIDLDMFAAGIGGDPATTLVMPVNAIHVNAADRLEISRCRIRKEPLVFSFYPAVFINARLSRILDNDIGNVGESSEVPAWQGLQLGSFCTDVEVRRNRIAGGFGHGITLGHISYRPVGGTGFSFPEPIVPIALSLGGGSLNPTDMQLVPRQLDIDLEDSGTATPHEPFSSGGVSNVRIVDNAIQGAGLSGISVAGFFTGLTNFVMATDIEIRGNVIRQNGLFLQGIAVPLDQALVVGMGGIALGLVLNGTISDNIIIDQGLNEGPPIAGIVAIFATDLMVSDNRIENNGPLTGAVSTIGLRGGVVVPIAARLNGETLQGDPATQVIIRRSLPTVRILQNTIVQPDGKTVFLNALGPVEVEGNYLENHGDKSAQAILGALDGLPPELLAIIGLVSGLVASSVQIIDIALPLDLSASSFAADQILLGVPLVQNGNIKFQDNQVVLDWIRTPPAPLLFGTFILSLDHVSYQENHVTVNMHNSETIPDPITQDKLTTLRSSPDQSMAVSSVIILAASLNISGNRFVEGTTDSMFSLLALGTPVSVLNRRYPTIVTDNVSTHCIFVISNPNAQIIENNFTVVTTDCEFDASTIPV